MNSLLASICLLFACAAAVPFSDDDSPKLWALVVAGSKGWYNYRHQSDVCHAYHILNKHGIPDERIVIMMYDDIAHNSQNPFPGKIFNKPHGKDVYHDVLKDYTGDDVTAQNFLNIMQGKKEAMNGIGSGKVIASGPNDHVFVYFTDHGGPGIVAFPSGPFLQVGDLNDALKSMHTQKKYGKLVFYMEACESGSMFENVLPKDINIYAMTASNAHESSWGCYCENPRHLPCLGDLFSVIWMQDSDVERLSSETLRHQYEVTRNKTTRSHVMKYGDLSILSEFVGDYQGRKDSDALPEPEYPITPVMSRDIPVFWVSQQMGYATTQAEKDKYLHMLNDMFQKRAYLDGFVKGIVDRLVTDPEEHEHVMSEHLPLTNLHCHKAVVTQFSERCFELAENPYAMKYIQVLTNLCEMRLPEMTIKTAIVGACSYVHQVDGGVH